VKYKYRTAGGVSVHVKGRNVNVTQALYDYVVQKMGKLDKYLDRLQGIDVELCAEATKDTAHQKHVEATAHVLGRTIRVQSDGAEMRAAVDDAVSKLYRQLNRQKERIKTHHGIRPAELLVADEAFLAGGEPEEEEDNRNGVAVVEVERLTVKPQFEDEAIEQMEALGKDFYVFLNARNEQVNVVYRRPDGAYRLIEPRLG
jgi:putative sigma-54 modulation protein